MDRPIEIFLSYAHSDEKFSHELQVHLAGLQREGLVEVWHGRDVLPGGDWRTAIDEHINRAHLILLLVSADFLASDYSYSVEVQRAIERHDVGDAVVVPIIVRACDWAGSVFSRLQALPRDALPVTSWSNRDEAWLDVARGIRRAVEGVRGRQTFSTLPTTPARSSERYALFEVFLKSGVPTLTFVEPKDFYLIKLALAQPGRGVVIEGPSGVGKTTAIRKAIEQLGGGAERRHDNDRPSIELLSARRQKDVEGLRTLEHWHAGTVIVDDFHRLPPTLADHLVDHLKDLADTESGSRKLVVVGIPRTGETLVDLSFDVATRIDGVCFS